MSSAEICPEIDNGYAFIVFGPDVFNRNLLLLLSHLKQ